MNKDTKSLEISKATFLCKSMPVYTLVVKVPLSIMTQLRPKKLHQMRVLTNYQFEP